VNYWMHNGFVRVDDEKMSKSLGNFFTVREVLAKYAPEVVRFFILRAHYRSPLNYSDAHLDDARRALDSLYITLRDVPPAATAIDWAEPRAARFAAAMDDDFNTPEALAVLFELSTEANRDKSAQASGLLHALGGVLGLLQADPSGYLRGPVSAGGLGDAEPVAVRFDDTEAGVSWDGPLVVLTNKFSASASEILAGAIQDYRRGIVVGDKATHGKGTVQSLLDLGRQLFQRLPNAPTLGAIKITMQQFYRPLGASTQLEGVKSDIELPSITTHLPVGESDLDHAIAFDKVPEARFQPSGRINDDLLRQLQKRSAERVG
jgi:hypothetical protein